VVVHFVDDGDVTDLDAVVDAIATDFFFVAANVVDGFWDDAGGDLFVALSVWPVGEGGGFAILSDVSWFIEAVVGEGDVAVVVACHHLLFYPHALMYFLCPQLSQSQF